MSKKICLRCLNQTSDKSQESQTQWDEFQLIFPFRKFGLMCAKFHIEASMSKTLLKVTKLTCEIPFLHFLFFSVVFLFKNQNKKNVNNVNHFSLQFFMNSKPTISVESSASWKELVHRISRDLIKILWMSWIKISFTTLERRASKTSENFSRHSMSKVLWRTQRRNLSISSTSQLRIRWTLNWKPTSRKFSLFVSASRARRCQICHFCILLRSVFRSLSTEIFFTFSSSSST